MTAEAEWLIPMLTKEQAREEIHTIIQNAVQRSGGNWRRAFSTEVRLIFDVIEEMEEMRGEGGCYADKGSRGS